MKRFLFDTSVWIDFFAGRNSKEVELLTHLLEEDISVFTCPVIIQEILQGIKNENTFQQIKESLLALPVLTVNPTEAAIGAAQIYRQLRKKGITIQKSNDCLIAFYALKNGAEVIHCDRDFDLIFKNLRWLDIQS
jgi:predicted nucleic acid-binding protein